MIPGALSLRRHHDDLRMPAAIVAGSGDKVVRKRSAERSHTEIPGSVLRVVEGAGHMVHHSAPRQVVEAIRPVGVPPLRVRVEEGVDRQFCAAGPFFALERWRAASGAAIRHGFDRAATLSNVGGPATVRAGRWAQRLGRAASLLLPAVLGEVRIEGPADALIGYLPDLERDVRGPLAEAGYADPVVAALGEGL